MREQCVALGLNNVLVIVLQDVVEAFDVLACDSFDHIAPVVRSVEAGVALAVGVVQRLHAVVG